MLLTRRDELKSCNEMQYNISNKIYIGGLSPSGMLLLSPSAPSEILLDDVLAPIFVCAMH